MKKSKSNLGGKHLTSVELPAPLPTLAPTLGHDQLLKALYWTWDVMERSSINLYVLENAYEAVSKNMPITGNSLSVSVRKNEWNSGARNVAVTFAPPLTETEDLVTYEYEGVPIKVHLLKDSETLINADTKVYHAEYFKYPNTYSQFLEEFPQFK
jgi:hypothetical protein